MGGGDGAEAEEALLAAEGESFLAVPALMACTTSNLSSLPSLPVPFTLAGSMRSERTRNMTAGDSSLEASE